MSMEALLMFSNCCKEIRKEIRSEKIQWLEDKGEPIQAHSDKGNLKEVSGESKQLCRKLSPQLSKLVANTRELPKKRRKFGTVDRSV